MNTVIDPPDLLHNLDGDIELEEDLSVNEIESVVELVMEQGLDMGDAIPESDDSDSDNFFKKMEIVWGSISFEPIAFCPTVPIVEYVSRYIDYFSIFTLLIDSPPPKV